MSTTYHSSCPHCGKAIRYREEHFSKKVRCPNKSCRGMMMFPPQAPTESEKTVLMKVPEPELDEIQSIEEVSKPKPSPKQSISKPKPAPPPKPQETPASPKIRPLPPPSLRPDLLDEDDDDEEPIELDPNEEYEVDVEEEIQTPRLKRTPGIERQQRTNRVSQIVMIVSIVAIPLLILLLVMVLMKQGL